MTRADMILGGLAAGCAACLVINSVRDMSARHRPVFTDENACDRAFEKRMYQAIQTSNWLSVLSGIGCAVAAVAFLKLHSAELAYAASAAAGLVGAAGAIAVLRASMVPCAMDATWSPQHPVEPGM